MFLLVGATPLSRPDELRSDRCCGPGEVHAFSSGSGSSGSIRAPGGDRPGFCGWPGRRSTAATCSSGSRPRGSLPTRGPGRCRSGRAWAMRWPRPAGRRRAAGGRVSLLERAAARRRWPPSAAASRIARACPARSADDWTHAAGRRPRGHPGSAGRRGDGPRPGRIHDACSSAGSASGRPTTRSAALSAWMRGSGSTLARRRGRGQRQPMSPTGRSSCSPGRASVWRRSRRC